ncbi:MAG: hypothetical protein LBS42_04050, partial [Tannerella sp.]|nr:hypothetical protein [Tannerella sp.]
MDNGYAEEQACESFDSPEGHSPLPAPSEKKQKKRSALHPFGGLTLLRSGRQLPTLPLLRSTIGVTGLNFS